MDNSQWHSGATSCQFDVRLFSHIHEHALKWGGGGGYAFGRLPDRDRQGESICNLYLLQYYRTEREWKNCDFFYIRRYQRGAGSES